MWRYAKASVRGSAHEKSGSECQDAIGCRLENNGILSAVVSDGAGSAPLGGRGAALCVSTVQGFISSALNAGRDDWFEILIEASKATIIAIETEAVAANIDVRDYAATLLAVVLKGNCGAALHIGDGVILTREPAGVWSWVFWPQKGEFANTTHFITDLDAADYIQTISLNRPMDAACLMTDGLESLALQFSTQSVFCPFPTGLLKPLDQVREAGESADLSAKLAQFLVSDRIKSRVDDDCSIIIASLLPEILDSHAVPRSA